MSSRRPGRREPRDGRTLRIVDETFWAREREMLGLRLSLLTEFVGSRGTRRQQNHDLGIQLTMRTALMDAVELQAEECRYLEYQIQCLNASLCRAGPSRHRPCHMTFTDFTRQRRGCAGLPGEEDPGRFVGDAGSL